MKKLVMLFVLFFSALSMAESVQASCYEKLLNGFSVESNAFQVYDEDADENFYDYPEEVSLKLIKKLEKKLVCGKGEIIVNKVNCVRIAPNIPQSLACYGESRNGYFFINSDMMGNFNIIFNRFD